MNIVYSLFIIFIGMQFCSTQKVHKQNNVEETVKLARCQLLCGTNEKCLSLLNELSYIENKRRCALNCHANEDGCSDVCRCLQESNNPVKMYRKYSRYKNRTKSTVELICRTENSLYIKWTNSSAKDTVYVTAFYASNRSSLLDVRMNRSPVVYDNLLPNTEYLLHIWSVDDSENILLDSKKFRTLPLDYEPGQILSFDVAEFFINDGKVDVVLQWEPAVDRTCYYSLTTWDARHEINTYEVIVRNDLFKYRLNNLVLNSNYSIEISGQSMDWASESHKTHIRFQTPSCLELYHNVTMCPPSSLTNLSIQVVDLHKDTYDVRTTWEQPDLQPDYYILHLYSDSVDGKNVNKTLNISGDAQEALFEDTHLGHHVSVRAVAVSKGGTSPETITLTHLPLGRRSERDPRTNIILYGAIAVILLAAATALVVFIHYRKRRNKFLKRSDKFLEATQINLDTKGDNCDQESRPLDAFEIDRNRLSLMERLGQGEFGVVHRAMLSYPDGNKSQQVAVKMLMNEPTNEEIRNFWDEIELMRTVGVHPHIVSILGCSSQNSERIFLVTEFCAKGDLQNYLRCAWRELMSKESQESTLYDCPPPEEECHISKNASSNKQEDYEFISQMESQANSIENRAYGLVKPAERLKVTYTDLLSYGRQIAMGMEHLSSKQVVHRDLAARNVLVCADNSVKIADFGLSRDIYLQSLYKKTSNGKLPVKWLALECLTHQIYTTQSDVWSFGVLMWEIMTLGATPYPTTPANMMVEALKTGHRMKRPTNCPEELYDLMLSCWNEKPLQRPTFDQLIVVIEDLLSKISNSPYLDLHLENDAYMQPRALKQ